MTLSEYLQRKKISLAAFGAEVGVSHTTVSRWASHQLFPRHEMLRRIQKATDGKVTPSDFLTERNAT